MATEFRHKCSRTSAAVPSQGSLFNLVRKVRIAWVSQHLRNFSPLRYDATTYFNVTATKPRHGTTVATSTSNITSSVRSCPRIVPPTGVQRENAPQKQHDESSFPLHPCTQLIGRRPLIAPWSSQDPIFQLCRFAAEYWTSISAYHSRILMPSVITRSRVGETEAVLTQAAPEPDRRESEEDD